MLFVKCHPSSVGYIGERLQKVLKKWSQVLGSLTKTADEIQILESVKMGEIFKLSSEDFLLFSLVKVGKDHSYASVTIFNKQANKSVLSPLLYKLQ